VVYEFAENVTTILWCLSETSNKALNAVNNLELVPFLMAFLSSRDKLPLQTVTSAAQCLYVLTDDNPPVADQVRVNFSYVSCLLDIAKARGGVHDVKGRGSAAEERTVTLGILACGAFGWRGSSGMFLMFDWKMHRYFAEPRTVPATVVHCVGRPR